MAVIRLDFGKAHIGRHRIESMDDFPAFRRGVEPVGVEADQTKACMRVGEGISQLSAMLFGDVEIIHRAGDEQIAVGVKPLGEPGALIAQIAFHLEIRVEAKTDSLSGLQAVGLPANDVCGVGSTLAGTSQLALSGGDIKPLCR